MLQKMIKESLIAVVLPILIMRETTSSVEATINQLVRSAEEVVQPSGLSTYQAVAH